MEQFSYFLHSMMVRMFGHYEAVKCFNSLDDLKAKFGFYFIMQYFSLGACYSLLLFMFVYLYFFTRIDNKKHKQITNWPTLLEACKNLTQTQLLRFFLKFSLFMIFVAVIGNALAYGPAIWYYFFPSVIEEAHPPLALMVVAAFIRNSYNVLIVITTFIVLTNFFKVIYLSFKYNLSYDEKTKKAVLELVPSGIVFASLLAIDILFYYHQVSLSIFFKIWFVCS